MRTAFFFLLGWFLLVIPEFLRIYFIMPFPGSQYNDTVSIAYFLHRYIFLFRISGLILIAIPLYRLLIKGKWWQKAVAIIFAGVAAVVIFMTTKVMQADKMFLQPRHKIMASVTTNTVNSDQLVIGVANNGNASCYPIQIIGYHHQVKDTVGGTPVLVTYCTVCRTGRVFSPFIDDNYQHFRLVGMDNFNAMLEDETTKSWWRQETGEAVAGPLKGKFLKEIYSQQMTLKSWITKYPETRILQPDPDFSNEYASLTGYDYGTIEGILEGTVHDSWQPKSWVIGIAAGNKARAYDWIELKKQSPLNDTLNNIPVLLVVESDMMTFHAWNRTVNGEALVFTGLDSLNLVHDVKTNSAWNYQGECVAGPLSGNKLSPIQAYQEFWHSWQSFHPNTSKYNKP